MRDQATSRLKRSASARLRRPLAVAGFYLTLSLITLNNLVFNFAHAVPGWPTAADYAIFYWNLWWVKYALLDLHRTPFVTNYVIFPNTSYLASNHTLSLTLDTMY
jgi:hypothetical protein